MPDRALESRAGTLFLVVGPSGVGKDTLLDAMRGQLKEDRTVVFARRYITRPASAGGEEHHPLTVDEFELLFEEGFFALSWQAHGLHYAISNDDWEQLRIGTNLIANVSRTVIDQARLKHQPTRIVAISASETALRARLAQRGRESAHDIEQRVARATAFHLSGDDVFQLENDGPVQRSTDQLLRYIGQQRQT